MESNIDIYGSFLFIVIAIIVVMPKLHCDYYRLVLIKKSNTLDDIHQKIYGEEKASIRKMRFDKKKREWKILKGDMWVPFRVKGNDWLEQQAQYLSHGYEMLLIPYDLRERTKITKLKGRAQDLADVNHRYSSHFLPTAV